MVDHILLGTEKVYLQVGKPLSHVFLGYHQKLSLQYCISHSIARLASLPLFFISTIRVFSFTIPWQGPPARPHVYKKHLP